MKTFKIAACFALVVAALAYAGLPPISVGGLVFKAPKSVNTTFSETNGWIVVKGSADSIKDTIQLDKTSLAPAGQKIAIEMAKALKGSRKDLVAGSFAEVVYGKFVEGAEGDYNQLTLSDPVAQAGKSFAISLKGITVGTVIAKKCAPTADNIEYAVLTEVKAGKGVVVTAGGKSPLGVLGGWLGDGQGTIGIAPGLTNYPLLVAQLNPAEMALAKATGKSMIGFLSIFSESLAPVNGKAKASLNSKQPMVGVHALEAGVGTNSLYKSKYAGQPQYDLVKP